MQEGLSPNHLKKAKLMFFYTRYPSSNMLKTYFSDVKVGTFCVINFFFFNFCACYRDVNFWELMERSSWIHLCCIDFMPLSFCLKLGQA